jgi:hypothetical protein
MDSVNGRDFDWKDDFDDDAWPGARQSEERDERLRVAAREVRSCVAAHSRRLSRNMMLRYKQHLKPHCVTVTELQVLVEIALRPHVTAAALSDLLELDKSTVSRIVDRLVENDWIGVAEPKDARAIPLVLQIGMVDRLLEALRAWREAHHSMIGWLGDDAGALKRLAVRVRPPPEPPH